MKPRKVVEARLAKTFESSADRAASERAVLTVELLLDIRELLGRLPPQPRRGKPDSATICVDCGHTYVMHGKKRMVADRPSTPVCKDFKIKADEKPRKKKRGSK